MPDGDFVLFFRDLLGRPEALDYFANLVVKNGRISRRTLDQVTPLESATSTQPLMDYLNPTTKAVEDAEVIAAAKLIHWSTNFAPARELQVQHMVGVFQTLMREADTRLGLDGRSASICCVVCDIRHQGRAKYTAMQAALGEPEPFEALLKLGSVSYPDRIKTLRAALAQAGSFASKTWSRSHSSFV